MTDVYEVHRAKMSRLQSLYDEYDTTQEGIEFFCYLYCLENEDFDDFFKYVEGMVKEEYEDCQ